MKKTVIKIQYPFLIKFLDKTELEEIYFNTIKPVYKKSAAKFIWNEKKLKAFPLKPVSRIGHPLSPFLFSVELEIIGRVVRQEKVIQ